MKEKLLLALGKKGTMVSTTLPSGAILSIIGELELRKDGNFWIHPVLAAVCFIFNESQIKTLNVEPDGKASIMLK